MVILLRVALLVLLVLGSTLNSASAQDPMAKWKPSLGDRFVYDRQVHSWSQVAGKADSSYSRDTVVMQIVKTDSICQVGDSTYQFVVVVDGATLNRDHLLYFYPRVNNSSDHPLAIKSLPDFGNPIGLMCDFSNSSDSQTTFGSRVFTVYPGSFTFSEGINGHADGYGLTIAYSPELKWFLHLSVDSWEELRVSSSEDLIVENLIMASSLGVHAASSSEDLGITVEFDGSLLRLSLPLNAEWPRSIILLDMLGRQVSSWSSTLSDVGREITLNVAGVPNGVYFLRLQGDGVDEVKKVCIVH